MYIIYLNMYIYIYINRMDNIIYIYTWDVGMSKLMNGGSKCSGYDCLGFLVPSQEVNLDLPKNLMAGDPWYADEICCARWRGHPALKEGITGYFFLFFSKHGESRIDWCCNMEYLRNNSCLWWSLMMVYLDLRLDRMGLDSSNIEQDNADATKEFEGHVWPHGESHLSDTMNFLHSLRPHEGSL